MLNLSLETNEIPADWKKAIITPIYKSGTPGTPSNYRPISTLPLTAKLLEKCVHLQLSTYLERNKLLTNKQFGFRSNFSTTKAIATLLYDIYTNINDNKYTKLCYIDLKKHSIPFLI